MDGGLKSKFFFFETWKLINFFIIFFLSSLKTEDNLNTVKYLPSNKILIETDCPWCEIRPTHAGFKYVKTKFPAVKKEKWESGKMVKGRNEPSNLM